MSFNLFETFVPSWRAFPNPRWSVQSGEWCCWGRGRTGWRGRGSPSSPEAAAGSSSSPEIRCSAPSCSHRGGGLSYTKSLSSSSKWLIMHGHKNLLWSTHFHTFTLSIFFPRDTKEPCQDLGKKRHTHRGTQRQPGHGIQSTHKSQQEEGNKKNQRVNQRKPKTASLHSDSIRLNMKLEYDAVK